MNKNLLRGDRKINQPPKALCWFVWYITLLKSEHTAPSGIPSPRLWTSSLQKAVRLVRQDLPLVNPARLLPVTLSLVATSVHRGIHPIHCPGIEMRLSYQSAVPQILLLPFLKISVMFVFFTFLIIYNLMLNRNQTGIWGDKFGKGVKCTFFLLRDWGEQIFQVSCRMWLGDFYIFH